MKLCATKAQYDELYKWLAKNYATGLRYLIGWQNNTTPFCVFPMSSVIYLKRKCPIQWVQDKIKVEK